MANRLWLTEDIANALGAVNVAHRAAAKNCRACDAEAYEAGFASALLAIAMMFGIPPLHVREASWSETGQSQIHLLPDRVFLSDEEH